jgi:hypothetical protein
MQKTAGTALFRRLKQQFTPAEIYPNETDGRPPESVLMIDHLEQRWSERRDEIRVVTGHFPLCTVDVLGVPFTTLTVLREPVERTLSFLRHHKKKSPADAESSLEEIYDDPIRFHGLIQNHMTKMLCLDASDMPGYAMTHLHFEPRHLDRAIERLAEVDVVGTQDRFEEFCHELERRFGWDLGEPQVANRTAPIPVTDEFRQRIAEDNELDIELYARAEALVAERLGPAPAT